MQESHPKPGRGHLASSPNWVSRIEPGQGLEDVGDTFKVTGVPQHLQDVLRLRTGTHDSSWTGPKTQTRPQSNGGGGSRVEKIKKMKTSTELRKGVAGAGNQGGHLWKGTVCARRALPAGTGAEARPGQMAAPETRRATGHQPNRPRTTTGKPRGRQSEVRGPAGQLWARLLDERHRCGGSHTLVLPKKHPSRVAPISGKSTHGAWCIAEGHREAGLRLLITVGPLREGKQ